MEIGLVFIASMSLIALLVLFGRVGVFLDHHENHTFQENLVEVLSEGHNTCIQKIISESEISKVEEILKHPHCTESMRSRIMGYYNPQTKSFFMRFADLYDFQNELLNNQNKNK